MSKEYEIKCDIAMTEGGLFIRKESYITITDNEIKKLMMKLRHSKSKKLRKVL